MTSGFLLSRNYGNTRGRSAREEGVRRDKARRKLTGDADAYLERR